MLSYIVLYMRAADKKVSTKGLCNHPDFEHLPHRFRDVYGPHLQGVLRKELVNELTPKLYYDLVIKACSYCGRKANPYNGVDRIDNAIGYTLTNSISCCKICNKMKSDLDYNTWIESMLSCVQYLKIK